MHLFFQSQDFILLETKNTKTSFISPFAFRKPASLGNHKGQ